MKKIIALYLPQFHEFEENNRWWGKGYTEWDNCRSAKGFFANHNQPRIPLGNNYYDLSNKKAQLEQIKLAKKYGIYGFCYYHYWFKGEKLMELPLENMLKDKSLDFPFCMSWANHNWQNKVQFKNRVMLKEQEYGGKDDWEEHFYYLLDFFRDERYIRVENKPILVIYDAKAIPNFEEMINYWTKLSKEEGLEGLYIVNTLKDEEDISNSSLKVFDAQLEYQPTFAVNTSKQFLEFPILYNARRILNKDILKRPFKLDYSKVWRRLIKSTPENCKPTILGSYVGWDTTPRWKNRGIVHVNDGPVLFKKFFEEQYLRNGKNINEILFITAWNEWGEGAYLEPDEKYEFEYLEAIKEITDKYKK